MGVKILTAAEVAEISRTYPDYGNAPIQDLRISHEALRADRDRLLGLINGMEHEFTCQGYRSCAKCKGMADICELDYDDCPDRVRIPCNCIKSKAAGPNE